MSFACSAVILLVCGSAAGVAPPASWEQWARGEQKRLAYSMAIQNSRVGWVIEDTRLGTHRGQPVLRVTSESRVETMFEGARSLKTDKSITCYALHGRGEVVFAEVHRFEDGKGSHTRIERVANKVRIQSRQGERDIERTVPAPKDCLAHQLELRDWLNGPRQKGDRFAKFSTDWASRDIDTLEQYTFRERATRLVEGKPAQVIDATIHIHGGRMRVQMLPSGTQLSSSLGGLMTMQLHPESEARKLPATPVDIKELTSIFVEIDLGQSHLIDSLKMEVKGLGDFQIPASHRQIVTPAKGFSLVELKRDFRPADPAPISKAVRKECLQATPRIQCDQEAIRKLASKIVGTETDPGQKIARLEAWVYLNLRKTYSSNADTSLEVLDNKAGDCTEHSLLFVALARAAGLPAREISGLAYVPDVKPLFGWHAWAEVHDGHQWVSVDPTWNQLQVDGTHLKLAEGEDDLAWSNVAGKIQIRVVEFARK